MRVVARRREHSAMGTATYNVIAWWEKDLKCPTCSFCRSVFRRGRCRDSKSNPNAVCGQLPSLRPRSSLRGQVLSRLAFGSPNHRHGRRVRLGTRTSIPTAYLVRYIQHRYWPAQMSRPSADTMGLQQGRCAAKRANRANIDIQLMYHCSYH